MNPILTRLARAVFLGTTLLAATACTDREAQRQAQAAAEVLAKERDATKLQGEYDAAVTAGNWELARVHGAALLAQYPGTQAAAVVAPALAEVTAKADATREQRSAAILSTEPVDTGGAAPATVQLVIRDHPEWKRSAYLVLQGGDFDCYGGCKIKVAFDDAAPKPMSAWRPKTDEAIAMFIEDYRGLWKKLRQAQRLQVEFPVKGGPAKAGGTRTAVFEVGGLDGSQMPGWD